MREDFGGDIIRDRSYSSVILFRRNNTMGPTGIYTCEILDAGRILQTLYIGVYISESQGTYVLFYTWQPRCIIFGVMTREISDDLFVVIYRYKMRMHVKIFKMLKVQSYITRV